MMICSSFLWVFSLGRYLDKVTQMNYKSSARKRVSCPCLCQDRDFRKAADLLHYSLCSLRLAIREEGE